MKKHWNNCVKKNKILSIMLMGKNKNLMFMLPAFCKKKKKVMVVIMLLIMLKQDMKKQCKKLKIDY